MAKQVKKQTKKTSKKSTLKKKKGAAKKVTRGKVKSKVTKKKAAPKKKQSKKVASKASSTKQQKAKTKVVKKKPLKKTKKSKANNPLLKPVTLSPELAVIVGGQSKLPRTEVVKKVWQYIKKHDLQDPKDRKCINADEKLKVIFKGRASVNMFELTKFVSKHLST